LVSQGSTAAMNSSAISFSFFFDHVKLSHRQHWFFWAGMVFFAVLNRQGGVGLFNMGSLALLTAGATYLFSLEYQQIEKSSASLEVRTPWLKRNIHHRRACQPCSIDVYYLHRGNFNLFPATGIDVS
jgi:predicted membrane-bound dolichyl-phosphate-mannose-protein mannosyltransferase